MKSRIEELAIAGGTPAFAERLHVGRPNVGDREKILSRLGEVIDSRWFTNNGKCVQEFEKALASLLGVRHCIAMCNATVALEITIRALGLTGEVIVPSMTFIATPHSLQWQEITPVFCDIDSSTFTVDPESIKRMITPRTSGIIGVHLWGRPCNVDAIADIAEEHGLKVLFDAAHAFGCSHKGKMIGCFGNAEVFSFHATKFFNTFEGGAVATNDDALAAKIRLMKNFGFSGYDEVTYIGTNGKMTEVCAVMGLVGLESLDEFISINRRNYLSYLEGVSEVPGLQLVRYDEREKNNFQYVVLQVDESAVGLSRDQIMSVLHAENVFARRYFHPGCHRMEPYRSFFPHAGLLLPETEALTDRVLSLPTGTAVTTSDIAEICQIIKMCVANSAWLREHLPRRVGA